MNKDFRLAFDVIDKVLREGAYINLILGEVIDKADNRALLTRITYGVIENNILLDYYIAQVVDRKPQKKVMSILKLGLYMLCFMDSVPPHAVVNEMVSLCTIADKKAHSGFVNATLKKCVDYRFTLPTDEKERLSVEYSVPRWIVDAYVKQYGMGKAREIITVKPHTLEHVRHNSRKVSREELAGYLIRKGIDYRDSKVGGFFVQNSRDIISLFDQGILTYQSVSSMLACRAVGEMDTPDKNLEILDICSAPGGKSVYLSELYRDAHITACDLYPHRIELVRDYARRMGAENIDMQVLDGTAKREEWQGKYDIVLADVPCSGLGVAGKKGDIYLNKSMEGVLALAEIQYKILQNAIDYAKPNGVIIYSTCTTLREENYNVVGKTLKYREDVRLEHIQDIDMDNSGYIQLLPDGNGMDGFFIARLRKC